LLFEQLQDGLSVCLQKETAKQGHLVCDIRCELKQFTSARTFLGH